MRCLAVQLICAFGFAYADCWFSEAAAKMLKGQIVYQITRNIVFAIHIQVHERICILLTNHILNLPAFSPENTDALSDFRRL